LPAATTTTAPFARAAVMARWLVASHVPLPPSDRLSTRARFGLAGTPLTVPPEAQIIASAMSEV
jgi:hypothetical protein